jgi:hypothetical protein
MVIELVFITWSSVAQIQDVNFYRSKRYETVEKLTLSEVKGLSLKKNVLLHSGALSFSES